ncbi:putative metalloprotease CJM1_0395 family protein [Methyloterricola oryzae]|uniref:putative metalloprotease CJM1_0395 family protein n=1 Tax=Methyloterricola oryzae TaxID=1495050 RepID=UPI0005EB60B3|nr:putative metalloprotease CJM1_0395 family protein [Methyloterricola oryzae]
MNLTPISSSFPHFGRVSVATKDTQPGAEKAGQDASSEAEQHNAQAAKAKNGKTLTEDELKQLQQLQDRDREVRAHEAAHTAAAGGLATGGASFSYQKGPDGGNYAVGGEVNIDTSTVANDPEATLRKAETIRRAALAPADPSSQDRRVAAAATQMQAQALSDLNEQRRKQQTQAAQAYLANFSDSKGEEPGYRVQLTA